jgi:alkylation response protein AidB-like acyl-CoA dehydrogenase
MSTPDLDLNMLRSQVRTWLNENVPEDLPLPERDTELTKEQRNWVIELRRKMGVKGWLAPSWPVYFGGADLAPAAAAIVQEELRNYRLPRFPLHPTWLTAVRVWGTEQQKGLWLARTLRGGITVAHNIGENRGTADIATRSSVAVLSGENYVVNGEEWYIPSQYPPDYVFLLVETKSGGPRRRLNLSTMVVDVHSEGVTTRERGTLMNTTETNYILQDVVVPINQRIGAEGYGGLVAQTMVDVQNGGLGIGPEQQREIEGRERDFWALK